MWTAKNAIFTLLTQTFKLHKTAIILTPFMYIKKAAQRGSGLQVFAYAVLRSCNLGVTFLGLAIRIKPNSQQLNGPPPPPPNESTTENSIAVWPEFAPFTYGITLY
jgi:hypothetical protein